jgi:hypothetical protein
MGKLSKTVRVRISPETAERLAEAAERQGVTISSLSRKALRGITEGAILRVNLSDPNQVRGLAGLVAPLVVDYLNQSQQAHKASGDPEPEPGEGVDNFWKPTPELLEKRKRAKAHRLAREKSERRERQRLADSFAGYFETPGGDDD